jgi:hypothetical protein
MDSRLSHSVGMVKAPRRMLLRHVTEGALEGL